MSGRYVGPPWSTSLKGRGLPRKPRGGRVEQSHDTLPYYACVNSRGDGNGRPGLLSLDLKTVLSLFWSKRETRLLRHREPPVCTYQLKCIQLLSSGMGRWSQIDFCYHTFVFPLSGGKDSCYNMMKCVAAGHEIVALANLQPSGQGPSIL